MRKKVIIILVSIFTISLLLVIGIKCFHKENIKQKNLSNIEKKSSMESEKKNDNEEKSNLITDKSNQEEQKNSNEEKKVEEKKKVDKKVNTDVSNNSTTSSSITSTNTKSDNQNNTVVETPKQDPVVPEQKPSTSVEQPKPTTSYVGVPNPNDFYYSFHKGHIDKSYSTLDGCYSRTADVSLLDTVDILNTTCMEVLDEKGTVLGIYMYVKCKSGNCDRYKSLVGIETN